MDDKRIEKSLSDAARAMIPDDMLERIMQGVSADNERTVIMNKNTSSSKAGNRKRRTLMSIAACFIAVVGLVGAGFYNSNIKVDSLIDLDVNPSIELAINSRDKVLSVTAINEDAQEIVGDMDLKNVDINVAVNALLGSMVQRGLLTDENSSILVTVQNADAKRAEHVRNLVVSDIDTTLKTNNSGAAVVNQTIAIGANADTDAKAFAGANSISYGKAVFIQNLVAKDATLDAAQLSGMSISDIAKLVSQKKIDIRDIVDYDADDSIWENIEDTVEDINEGDFYENDHDDYYDDDYYHDDDAPVFPAEQKPQTKPDPQPDTNVMPMEPKPELNSYIPADKAKNVALNHAGIDENAVSFIKAEFDRDDGRAVYELEFTYERMEYEYEIDASTGEIVSWEKEIDD